MREEPLNLPVNPYAPPVADDYTRLDDELDQEFPAGPGVRFAAAMIDAVALYAPLVILGGIAFAVSDKEAAMTTVGVAALVVMLPIGIWQLVWLSSRGQTIGKRVMGIKIVKMDMTPGGFWSFGVVRGAAVPVLSGVIDAIVPFRIGSLLILIDCLFVFAKDHRCLHDHLAKTRVVMDRRAERSEARRSREPVASGLTVV